MGFKDIVYTIGNHTSNINIADLCMGFGFWYFNGPRNIPLMALIVTNKITKEL